MFINKYEEEMANNTWKLALKETEGSDQFSLIKEGVRKLGKILNPKSKILKLIKGGED